MAQAGRRVAVGAGALRHVLGDGVPRLRPGVILVARRVEDGHVDGRGVRRCGHGPQNRSGCAVSHSFAARISSGPAAGASSAWRSVHAATYGQSGATALSSRAATA